MQKDGNFDMAGGRGRSTPRKRIPRTKRNSGRRGAVRLSGSRRLVIHSLDSRPSEVERARRLIADINYPTPLMTKALARQLAVQLTSEGDPLT